MSTMTNFTIRSLRANRVRTFVTVAGVALAAALLAAILTSYASLTDFLYRSEAAMSGTWMSYVASDDSDELDEKLQAAEEDPNVTDLATLSGKGFAQLSEEQQNQIGHYLSIVAFDGDAETLLAIHPSEGRLPQNDHEVILFKGWHSSQDVEIGDTLTFQVGQRQVVATSDSAWTTEESPSFATGSFLDFGASYIDSDDHDGQIEERLVGLHPETYTVVGFYERNQVAASSVGTTAITYAAPAPGDYTQTYLCFGSANTTEDVVAQTKEIFGESDIVLHSALLRFMGISSDTGMWQTFFYLVVILLIVIALACISLIFNAFNISVAERIRGFALLSSVGATPAQLRRAVFFEGFIIAVIGIPLGLSIGLVGCAITFSILGPSIADLAAGGIVPFELKLDAGAIGIAALLTALTVLVSVWIPSKRASQSNIIESLRQRSTTRVSKRGERAAAKAVYSALLWRKRGILGRFFGIGGNLAHIERKRSASKGRAAALSLALAIVLLMTAGSLNTFLGSLVDTATGGVRSEGEVSVNAQIEAKKDTIGTAPLTAQELLLERNRAFAEQTTVFQQFYDDLAASPEAVPIGWQLTDRIFITVPESMTGTAFEEGGMIEGGVLEDGRWATSAAITYLDDESFDHYVRDIGDDPAAYHDPAHPRAVALAQTYGNNGEKYQLADVFGECGTVQVFAAATLNGEPVADLGFSEEVDDEGATHLVLEPWMLGEHDGLEAPTGEMQDFDIAEVDLEIAAITSQNPLNNGPGTNSIMLFVPLSLAYDQERGLGCSNPLFASYFNSADGDHAALATELSARSDTFFEDLASFDLAYVFNNDLVEAYDSTQMLATIVNVFCLLFTVILALIAMANVFNTVTNSLILRRREFAVMQSVGLSPRQFRRMIIDECLHFGFAGLIPGLIVSFGVSYALYGAVAQSVQGLAFTMPWGYVGIAFALTITIMALSVAYGLHRCKSNSVVEALRADSI